jgi:hypothetical protein
MVWTTKRGGAMGSETNPENTTFNDDNQTDQSFEKKFSDKNVTNDEAQLSPAEKSYQDEQGHVDPDSAVRLNEDASLPDKQYSFGEDNTGNEEYHDASDVENDQDYEQETYRGEESQFNPSNFEI